MRGIRLDPLTHDLSLDAGGRIETIDGDEATAQEIRTRLLFFRSESFTDQTEGIPWYQEILVKGGDLGRVRAIIRACIASVPAIVDVPLVNVEVDRTTRTGTITWEARTNTGTRITSADFPPLVIPAA
tara:strand:- start:376 stop:759 length:384 start_codon:yes stop_codon:yes gene_type:complete